MPAKILNLEAASVEELKQSLTALSDIKGSYVNLSISGPKVMVRQFDLPKLPLKELQNSLALEAAELLSLHPEEIELDYQVLDSDVERIKGVFLASPKQLLEDYFLELTQAKLIPVVISAVILKVADSFLSKTNFETKSFYLINFGRTNMIDLVVFQDGRCELLRDISCEDMDEAKKEIENSLRYASSKFGNKMPEQVFFTGELQSKQELISHLVAEFGFKVEQLDLKEQIQEAKGQKPYFTLNLIKNYSLPVSIRKNLSLALNLIMAIAVLISAATIIKVVRTEKLLKDLNAAVKSSDYDYVQKLQDKVKALNHEK